MSKHDFDARLQVLCRLLKLNSEQAAAVSRDLRQQLDQRVEEVVRTGKPRSDAIDQAIEEFGDAAGMAADLTRVSQLLIRRWVIGATLVSAVALAVALGAVMMLEWRRLPVAQVAAPTFQFDVASIPQQETRLPSLLLDPQPDNLELPQLSEPCSINFVEDYPLEDALLYLAKKHHVSIVLDPVMLLDGIIAPDQPVNVPPLGRPADETDEERSPNWPHEVTLAQALSIMLAELDLTWQVKDRIITVTTIGIANDPSKLMTRSYNIEPLIRSGISLSDLEYILKWNSNTNAMWEDVDGVGGTTAFVGRKLIVRQSYQDQREIRSLLFKLARPDGSPWIEYAAERESLARLLKQPCPLTFPPDMPLSDFLAAISRKFQAPILLDPLMLLDGIVTPDQPVNAPRLDSAPLETVLRLSLEELDLTLVLLDGLPMVTSVDIANDPTELPTAIYDARKILSSGAKPDALIDAVLSAPNAQWEEIDGTGGRVNLTENGLLVVTQADAAHRSLQEMLAFW